jgi:hypothetical protein
MRKYTSIAEPGAANVIKVYNQYPKTVEYIRHNSGVTYKLLSLSVKKLRIKHE